MITIPRDGFTYDYIYKTMIDNIYLQLYGAHFPDEAKLYRRAVEFILQQSLNNSITETKASGSHYFSDRFNVIMNKQVDYDAKATMNYVDVQLSYTLWADVVVDCYRIDGSVEVL